MHTWKQGGNSGLQDLKRLQKTSTARTSDFSKTSKDFQRFQKTLKDFKRLQTPSKDCTGLQETSRDF
jgi:hypothetical protein